MPKYLRQFVWGTAAGGMAVLKMQTGAWSAYMYKFVRL